MFIAFEGIRKSGKTTQLNKLVEWLKVNTKIKLYKTEEPFGRDTIRQLNECHYSGSRQLDLILADRKDHIKYVILPTMDCFYWVFCENFLLSTVANQGYGHGLDIPRIYRLNAEMIGDFKPDLTIVLDCFIDEAVTRNRRQRAFKDYQDLDLVFLDKARLGYLEEAGKQGYTLVDGNREEDVVFEEIKELILPLLPEEEKGKIAAKLF